ncbi:hypothetical protein BKA58DRAFT_450711 [Alternaria rosae]|uniref:uncharacterized protein n=1 Tax=Alternaria rosae TaxID=1187941 RepID=UPI001E8D6B9A|nr:uncharacterized protein BKA58DRAFT_450711 [Alternaria rosae]KAH6851516.1 hypothetical protein BKA58DRAFT_450711 [Alternaria rosae]
MRVSTATTEFNGAERERSGTASPTSPSSSLSPSPPDDVHFDMSALAVSLRSRRDSIHPCGAECIEDVEMYYVAQPGLSGDCTIDDETSGDLGMEDNSNSHSPTPSSVYSNDNTLPYPLHSFLYTQSESGIPDNDEDNTSFNFLDEVLLDLDTWLVAGGLEMGGLHDTMTEEEYAKYKEWYKAVVGGVARGMVERVVGGGGEEEECVMCRGIDVYFVL